MALVLTLGMADLGDPANNFLAVLALMGPSRESWIAGQSCWIFSSFAAETVRSGIVITKTVVDSGAALTPK